MIIHEGSSHCHCVAQVTSDVDKTESLTGARRHVYNPKKAALVGQGTHALSILVRVLEDPSLAPNGPRQFIAQYPDTLTTHEDKIRPHVDRWTIDLSIPREIERKMEECIWTTSVMYAVGGWSEKWFMADFFLMHLVTSSLSTPSPYPCLLERKFCFSVCTSQAQLHHGIMDIMRPSLLRFQALL